MVLANPLMGLTGVGMIAEGVDPWMEDPTVCSVIEEPLYFSDDLSGGLGEKYAAAPKSFAVAPFEKYHKPKNLETGRAHSSQSFKKTFGVSVAAFYRYAEGTSPKEEGERIAQLIASDQALQTYYNNVEAGVIRQAHELKARSFIRELSPSDLASFLFSEAASYKEFSKEIVTVRILRRLQDIVSSQKGSKTQNGFLHAIRLMITKGITGDYFRSLAVENEEGVPVIYGYQIAALFVALEDKMANDTPDVEDADIDQYLNREMTGRERKSFAQEIENDFVLAMRVQVRKQKTTISNRQGRESIGNLSYLLAGLVAEGLDPGEKQEIMDQMESDQAVADEYARVFLLNVNPLSRR